LTNDRHLIKERDAKQLILYYDFCYLVCIRRGWELNIKKGDTGDVNNLTKTHGCVSWMAKAFWTKSSSLMETPEKEKHIKYRWKKITLRGEGNNFVT